jgi:hypothetical protein
MFSLKAALKSAFDRNKWDYNIDLKKGVWASLLNDFYKEHPGSSPYKSIRGLLKALEWPTKIDQIDEYPANSGTDWSNEINGVANDEKNWFIIQKNRIWKFPGKHNLQHSVGVFRLDMPPSDSTDYDHCGDSDYYKHPDFGGLLFVPLEHIDKAGPGRIALFKSSTKSAGITYMSYADMMHKDISGNIVDQPDASWCAINRLNGLLYTCQFDSPAPFLYVYKPHMDIVRDIIRLKLEYLGKFWLFNEKDEPLVVHNIQGGVFSNNGHLYLVSDWAFWAKRKDLVNSSGIIGFDMATGRRVIHTSVYYEPLLEEITYDPILDWIISSIVTIRNQELEGIDIWDLKSTGIVAPHINGQIHLMMNENPNSQVFFKHFSVSSGDEDKI